MTSYHLDNMRRPVLLLICLVALVHAALFIVYQYPDRDIAWTDQGGYQRLGAAFAETGRFTRYPDYPTFVPEVIRTPGYPAFVGVVYTFFGVGNDVAVAVAQAFVFAAICLLAYAMARRVGGERAGTGAGLATALFPTIPYFGALVLTEVWATLVVTAGLFVCLRAVQEGRRRDYLLAGVLFGCATLVRPVFVLLPFFLAIAMPLLVGTHRTRRALGHWAMLAVAASIVLLPWFTYNYVHLGKFTLSPAGGVGRGLWEGSWQGRWPGRVHSLLTTTAAEDLPRGELDARVRAIAAEGGFDAEPMLVYVHEWRDIRRIWDSPVDPLERADARVVADQAYLRAALGHIAADPLGHVLRRVSSGPFFLWATDIPIRYSDINSTPTVVIRAIWLAQVTLLLLAACGIGALVWHGRWAEAVFLALPLVYVTGVHLPLLCEARQSLPVKPLVIVLAAVGVSRLRQGFGEASVRR